MVRSTFWAWFDRKLARGYPHQVELREDAADTVATARRVLRLRTFAASNSDHYEVSTAIRVVRGFAASLREKRVDVRAPAVRQALEDASRPRPGEACAIVQRIIASGREHPRWLVADSLLILEALVGAAPVARAIMDALQELPPRRWFEPDAVTAALFVGYIRLRMTTGAATIARRAARLVRSSRSSYRDHPVRAALSHVAFGHGFASTLPDPAWLGLVRDPAMIVAGVRAMAPLRVSARLIYLAPACLGVYRERVRDLDPRDPYLRALSWFRSPVAGEILRTRKHAAFAAAARDWDRWSKELRRG